MLESSKKDENNLRKSKSARARKYLRIGKALHISSNSGNLISKITENVHIGNSIYAKNKKMIGRIYDIFGAVTNPYISITLNDKSERTRNNIIGKDLYVRMK